MLPQYEDKEKEVPVTDAMKAQGILERSTGQWFFRVTEAQYNELMEPYWEAYLARRREGMWGMLIYKIMYVIL